MPKIISFAIAKERFKNRNDIVLCQDGFVSWKQKAKFFDIVAQEYFWSVPSKVLERNSVHPKRRKKLQDKF
jgi:hypothetical protein